MRPLCAPDCLCLVSCSPAAAAAPACPVLPEGHARLQPHTPVLLRLAAISVSATWMGIAYNSGAPWPVTLVGLLLWAAATATFHALPQVYTPTAFRVPGVPWFPSLAMLAMLHLIASLGANAYWRWLVVAVAGTLVYVLYGMHHTPDSSDEGRHTLWDNQQPSSSGSIDIGGGEHKAVGSMLTAAEQGQDAAVDAGSVQLIPSGHHNSSSTAFAGVSRSSEDTKAEPV